MARAPLEPRIRALEAEIVVVKAQQSQQQECLSNYITLSTSAREEIAECLEAFKVQSGEERAQILETTARMETAAALELARRSSLDAENAQGHAVLIAVCRRLESAYQRVDTALFAENTDNEFQQMGVMTTMKRLDAHLDTLCTLAKAFKAGFKGVAATAAFVLTVLGIVKFFL